MQETTHKKKFRLPPPGWHAVRISLAVFVALAVLSWFEEYNPFYAAIAAVVCTKPDLKSSHQMGVRRILGTMAGGAVGLGAMLLFEKTGSAWEPYLLPVFVFVIIYLCKLIGLNESASIGCIVLLSVVIMHKPEGMQAYHYVLNRLIETGVGVLAAVLVNFAFDFAKFLLRRRHPGPADPLDKA